MFGSSRYPVILTVNFCLAFYIGLERGETMDFLMNFFSAINFELIFQLLFLALIFVAGPVVVFLLALQGGDL